jgi:hypothetical protein
LVRSRIGCRVAVVVGAVAVAAGATVAAGLTPADGVQTARFGLAAAGARSKIVHPAGQLPVRDSVVVTNRTAATLTLTLAVVGVTKKPSGGFDLGAAGAGLAGHIRLDRLSVRLPAHGRQLVALTVDGSDNPHATSYAAVTAVEATPARSGVAVSERLAVLVEVDKADVAAGRGATHGTRTVAVVIATLLPLALLAILVLRRRRSAADRAP